MADIEITELVETYIALPVLRARIGTTTLPEWILVDLIERMANTPDKSIHLCDGNGKPHTWFSSLYHHNFEQQCARHIH